MQIEKMRAFIIRVLFYCIILGLAYAVLKYALPFLMPFLVAFLIAFILKPVINWVTQKTKLGRKPVSVLLLIAFYVLAAALITVLGTRLVIFCRDIFYALPQVYDTVVAPALNSLQGAFSARVNHLVEALTHLRIYVEAAIDFPDEEIDFLSDGKIEAQLNEVMADLDAVRAEARQGSLLREGMKVVIAGRPNAGKSSLLNALAGREAAIVTDIAGTTRDVLREHIHIDGMPLHIIDTAGLRDANDEVERIGIERAWQEIAQADRVLFMVDGTTTGAVDPAEIWPDFIERLPAKLPITVVRNKADVTGEALGISEVNGHSLIRLSARTGEGVEVLRNHLKQSMGFDTNMEGGFLARRRHLQALEEAANHLQQGKAQLLGAWAGELLAEELRLAQQALSEITGEFTSDDLLGRIFSSFCIGK